jgi:hypothetical protein
MGLQIEGVRGNSILGFDTTSTKQKRGPAYVQFSLCNVDLPKTFGQLSIDLAFSMAYLNCFLPLILLFEFMSSKNGT